MKINDSVSNKLPRGLMFRWSLWFMLANAVVLMLVSLNYLKYEPLPAAPLARIFLGLSFPGHFVSLASYVFPLIAVGIIAFPVRKFVFSLAIVLELFVILAVIIDSLVFAQYRFHLNGMVWNLITSGAATDVLPVTGMLWLILLIAIAVLAVAEWLVALAAWKWVLREGRQYGVGLGVMIALVILAGHVMHAWADANNYTPITRQVRYLPAYKPLTMKRMLVRLGLAHELKKNELKFGNEGSALTYPLEKITCTGDGSHKMNLLLIVIDSWRFDTLTPEIAPNIWQFSKDSWRFDHHFSSGNGTRFGIFGLFYGLYGTYWHTLLAEEKSPVLMRELEKQAYRMGIYASAPLINPEFDRTVFADIRTKIELRQGGERVFEKDRLIANKMVDFLAHNPANTPFFGFLFFDSPHSADHPENLTPFQPALKEVNHLTLNNSTDPVPYFNKYRNSVHYVDSLVGNVLAQLAKSKMLDNTIVIVTGDHGEEFNDLKLNYWGHTGNFARFQTQTPLVVRWPGQHAAVYTHATSHLDIAPTLMKSMFGCVTDPAKFSNGRYLMDTTPRPYVLISSWGTFSTVEPDRITVARQNGEIDILDPLYRELAGAKVRPDISKSAMEGMGRFFAR